MKKLMFFIIIFTLLFTCSENKKSAQSTEQQTKTYKTKIDNLLKTYEKNGEFMGSIALSSNRKTIYTNAIGFDDIETKKKSDVNTKYRIGSVSKTYTAVLIFKANEENKLTLEQTIENYFPTIKNANKITIAQLLQHRSGIPNFTKDKNFLNYHTEYKSPLEMLTLISNLGSDFEPNSKGQYSNSNYFLLSQILEKAYELSYQDILKTKICEPLNLINTYNGNKVDLINNESNSYSYATEWEKLPETDMSITLGAGSIVSNPIDVATFTEALFMGKIISIQSLEKMQTIKDGYGMGLVRYTIADRKGFGHRGTLDGYKSTAIYFPEEKLSLVITSNASKDNINLIYLDVLKLYLDDAPIEISEDEIKKYVGTYEEESSKFTFIQDKNVLVLVIKNEFKEPLIYKGNNRFLFEQMYAESMSFTFSLDGLQLILEQGDAKGTYVKK
ncbi:MAG: serine hydrolase domain-containing protein [Psychroserpens sp.]|uniref:serine hydrolase domain-containing protein n=1 Tax=Psychroserpens sp. TaxID=2020870 RepID=UPI003001C631